MRTIILKVEDNCIIGCIRTDLTEAQIREEWDKWREAVPQPDADSEFVEWLLDRHPEIEDCEIPETIEF